jgi:hypothetical protein
MLAYMLANMAYMRIVQLAAKMHMLVASKCARRQLAATALLLLLATYIKYLLLNTPFLLGCRRGVSNQVQLSTYADAIGDNLGDLTSFLQSDELQGNVLHLELTV